MKNLWVLMFIISAMILTSCGGLREHIRERQQATHGNHSQGRKPKPADTLSQKLDIPDNGNKGIAYYEKKWQVSLSGNEDLAFLKEIDAWLGVPYVYGGESKSGTDCSGMIQTIYQKQYKILLKRSANDMQKDVDFISLEKAKLGDLVFFKINFKTVGHVALYLGQKRFIHATTSRGVIISSLEEEYYKKRFYKVGRINHR